MQTSGVVIGLARQGRACLVHLLDPVTRDRCALKVLERDDDRPVRLGDFFVWDETAESGGFCAWLGSDAPSCLAARLTVLKGPH